jgi:ornithine cyclodeaminase/alanine dehydrogenase-like protein (mu-crystallin family)
MLVLTRSDLEQVLPFDVCIDEMRTAMIATSERRCVLPIRQFMPVPGRPGKLGLMPGYIGGESECFGVKIVSKYERAAGDPHGSHVGAVLLLDAATGLPIALMEGGTLTAIRTASMTALATDALARPDARRLAMLGTGEEAWYHVRALRHVRPFDDIMIWGRSPARAQALVGRLVAAGIEARVVEDAAEALAQADVACTVTSAKEPFVRGEWLPRGLHLNLVGSAIPTTAEVDDATVARGRFFVDYVDAARAAAGELLSAIRNGVVGEDHVAGEIGEVLIGRVPGRRTADEITIYKSLGVTTQDLAAGHRAWREARARGIGQPLELDQ